MDDYLPPIRIFPRGATCSFLQRMPEIAAATGEFETETLFDDPDSMGMDVVNLRAVNPEPHEDLGVQFVADPDEPGVIKVEIRARRWHPQDPPTYETYSTLAKDLVKPLLREFNRTEGTRLRLSIVPKNRLEPSLPPACERLFKEFTSLANKRMLHPRDWQRFYRFVSYCRAKRIYTAADIARMLIKEGFPDDLAASLGDLYVHLREFKRTF